MSAFVRGVALGMLLALAVAALTACGNEGSPTHAECAKPPYCPPDFLPPSYPVAPT